MIDIKKFLKDELLFDEYLNKRNIDISKKNIIKNLYDVKLTKKQNIESIQALVNLNSDKIKKKDFLNDAEKNTILKESANFKKELIVLKEEFNQIEKNLSNELSFMPNELSPEVPFGLSEEENVVQRVIGVKKEFNFKPKPHHEVGIFKKYTDFAYATKISGSRFSVLKSKLCKLERSIIDFLINENLDNFKCTEVSTPLLVNKEAMFGTGQLPKFDNGFITNDGRYLIPTQEVTLANIYSNEIVTEEKIPTRLTSVSNCFRSEAGAAGRDTKGIIRQHQFTKVELVSIVNPDESENEHLLMVSSVEKILQKLNLHYRVSLLCSGDTGFSSNKTYDIEVWMPGQDRYVEISSCSNTKDFQSRRMNCRCKRANGDKFFPHILNGSSLPIGRTLAAIIENYQQQDGSIEIPECLKKYFHSEIID